MSITIIFEVSVTITVTFIRATRSVTFALALTITVPVAVTSVIVSVASVIPARRVVTACAAGRGRTSSTRRSSVSTTVTAGVKAPGRRRRSAGPLLNELEWDDIHIIELSNSPQSLGGHHGQCVCCAFHGKHRLHHDGFHILRKRT